MKTSRSIGSESCGAHLTTTRLGALDLDVVTCDSRVVPVTRTRKRESDPTAIRTPPNGLSTSTVMAGSRVAAAGSSETHNTHLVHGLCAALIRSRPARANRSVPPAPIIACISHHPTAEAHDTTARTSLRLLAVLNVLFKYACARQAARARPEGPLTHFASPRGEKCRSAVCCRRTGRTSASRL